jgi:hypothetical protein
VDQVNERTNQVRNVQIMMDLKNKIYFQEVWFNHFSIFIIITKIK